MEILELINNGSKKLQDKRIYSHKLDSEILLSRVLNKSREELLINLKQKIKPREISNFLKLIDRRSSKEPIAYILEEKEFWSKSFLVSKNTLVPRPETELMVEKIVKIFNSLNMLNNIQPVPVPISKINIFFFLKIFIIFSTINSVSGLGINVL